VRAWRQLGVLAADADLASALPPNPDGRAELRCKLAALPVTTPKLTRFNFRRLRPILAALAACLLLAIGWMAGRSGTRSPAPQVITVQAPTPVTKPGVIPASPAVAVIDSKLLARLTTQVAALGYPDPSEQLKTLRVMADDIRVDAFRAAKAHDRDSLIMTASLYDLVMKHGIITRCPLLKEADRKPVSLELVRELREAAADLQREASLTIPAVADYLRRMALSTTNAAELIAASDYPKPATQLTMPEYPLAAVIVVSGLKLIEAGDPYVRASIAAQLAERVAPTVAVLAMNDEVGSERLADSMSSLLSYGVAENLDETSSRADRQPEEIAAIHNQVLKSKDALEQSLHDATPAARAQIESAVRTIAPGMQQAAKAGNDKAKPKKTGPPWLRDGKSIPPGHMKQGKP